MDLEQIFNEVVQRGFEAGVRTREAYSDLVEEVIEEHRGLAEADMAHVHDDEDTEGYEDRLEARFEEYLERLKDVQA